MAFRKIRYEQVKNIPVGGDYKPEGTLGYHHVVVTGLGKNSVIIQGSSDDHMYEIKVGKYALYNCGKILIGKEESIQRQINRCHWLTDQYKKAVNESEKLGLLVLESIGTARQEEICLKSREATKKQIDAAKAVSDARERLWDLKKEDINISMVKEEYCKIDNFDKY